MKGNITILVASALMVALCRGQTSEPATPPPDPPGQTVDDSQSPQPAEPVSSAYEAVHRGNGLLLDGDASSALGLYEQAKKLKPNTPEISFVEGLARYRLGEYEAARELFEQAVGASDEQLANDALYAVGATQHAEALQASDDPKQAIEKLERAIEHYQNVLANEPTHEDARDAIRKAATLRRQIKQVMEQQQKPQDSSDKDSDNDDDKDESSKQDLSSSDQDKDNQQDPSQSQENDDQKGKDQQDKPQNESDQDTQKQDQKPSSSDKDQKQEQDQQQASAQKLDKQDAQDQAQRQLREMMQALRQRQKTRKEKPQPVQTRPVAKDW